MRDRHLFTKLQTIVWRATVASLLTSCDADTITRAGPAARSGVVFRGTVSGVELLASSRAFVRLEQSVDQWAGRPCETAPYAEPPTATVRTDVDGAFSVRAFDYVERRNWCARLSVAPAMPQGNLGEFGSPQLVGRFDFRLTDSLSAWDTVEVALRLPNE